MKRARRFSNPELKVEAENQGYVLPGSKPISPEQQRIDEFTN